LFRLLTKGAYPHAGMQLIEALREYERELARRAPEDERRYWSRSRRSEFSWSDVLGEYLDEPLAGECLRRQNWAKVRPTLYVATYITERNNLVIEVRPCLDSGLRYMGVTMMKEEGDFRYFPAYTPPYGRPTNRVLYIPLGDVSASLRYNEPWFSKQYGGARYASERRIILLAVKAKLHQLSLHFECYIDRELIEFGPESFIDFRRPTGDQAGNQKYKPAYSREYLDHFDPAQWAPPRIREFLTTSGLGLDELYAFARDYLAGLPVSEQVTTYAQYLAGTHASRVTAEDVAELLRYGTDPAHRKARMLDELAVDASFASRMQKDHLFDYFCRKLEFTEEEGIEWVMTHHPEALEHIGRIPIPTVIKRLKSRKTRARPELVEQLDRCLAACIARDEAYRWHSLPKLMEFLDAQAMAWDFASFAAFQAWARTSAPLSFDASAKLHGLVAQRIEALKSEAAAKRTAANNRRKSTRAAKKASSTGASQ